MAESSIAAGSIGSPLPMAVLTADGLTVAAAVPASELVATGVVVRIGRSGSAASGSSSGSGFVAAAADVFPAEASASGGFERTSRNRYRHAPNTSSAAAANAMRAVTGPVVDSTRQWRPPTVDWRPAGGLVLRRKT